MWDDYKRRRLEQLRRDQTATALTGDDLAELDQLVRELEAAEAVYLTAATSRLGHERAILESQNRTLEALARRKEALAARLHDVLVETNAERRSIESELAATLASLGGAETGK
jgi:hypothetical protein